MNCQRKIVKETYDGRGVLLCCLMLVAFFAMSLCTPLWSDDYMYLTMHERAAGLVHGRVSSVTDLLQTVGDYYMHGTEGRWLNNGLLLHFMLSFTPHAVFALVNTLMWAGLTWCITRLVVGERLCTRKHLSEIAIVGMGFFLILAARHDTLFWRSGSVNYLWSGVVYLSYFICSTQSRRPHTVVLCVFAFFTGAFSEAFGVPFALYVAYDFLRHRDASRFAVACCFALGLSTILFAPSTIGRINESRPAFELGALAADVIRGFVKNFMSAPAFALVVLACGIGMMRKRRQTVAFLRSNDSLVVIILSYVLVFSFLGKNAMRMHFPLALFSYILLVRFLLHSGLFTNKSYMVSRGKWLVPVGFVLLSAVQITDGVKQMQIASNEAYMIRTTTDGVVRAEVMRPFTDPDNLINRSYAAYYGAAHSLVALPPDVYDSFYDDADDDKSSGQRGKTGVVEIRSGVYVAPNSKFVIIKADQATNDYRLPKIKVTYAHRDYGVLNALFDQAYPSKVQEVDNDKNTMVVRSRGGKTYVVANADDFGFFTEIKDVEIYADDQTYDR